MLAGYLGREGFRRGMDLYFQRHDGQAVTCDDFVAALPMLQQPICLLSPVGMRRREHRISR